MSKNELHPGEELKPGQELVSPNGYYSLSMQEDGNLVVYHHGQARWASDTAGQPVKICAMQPDGNLVLYTAKGPVFATNTEGNEGAYLALQDDGNAVIYKGSHAIWATDTVDSTRIKNLPHQISASKKIGSGHHIELNATISQNGKINGSVHLKCTNNVEGFTGGWSIILGDRRGNFLYATPLQTAGVNASGLKPKEERDVQFAYDYPGGLEKQIGSCDIFLGHTPKSWERISDALKKAKEAGKSIREIMDIFS